MKLVTTLLILSSFGIARAQAAPTIITLLGALIHCTPGVQSVITSNGSGLTCSPLGPGLSINPAGQIVISVPTPSSPSWQVESISLASLNPTATSVSYTTSKPVAAGVILYWYNSANVAISLSGAVAFTGNPLTIALPTGWTPTDTITVVYQAQ